MICLHSICKDSENQLFFFAKCCRKLWKFTKMPKCKQETAPIACGMAIGAVVAKC